MNSETSNTTATQWSLDQFKVYVLLYCANAEGLDVQEMHDLIKYKVGYSIFRQVCREFSQDSDFTCIHKIQEQGKALNLQKAELKMLLTEVREFLEESGHNNAYDQLIRKHVRRMISE